MRMRKMNERDNLQNCGGGRSEDGEEMSEYDSYYGCNILEKIYVYKICVKSERVMQ